MANVYELNTIADLLKIPPEKLGECLRDIEYGIELCHLAGGEHAAGMSFDSFKWTDDGKHDVDMAMNGEPLLKLSVTEEPALSHAAGQEAVAEGDWPEYVMLRDTKLNDDMGGLGQRIFTTAGSGYVKQKYIRADLTDTQPSTSAEVGRDD